MAADPSIKTPHLGLKAHLILPRNLIEAGARFDLGIAALNDGTYAVHTRDNGDISGMIPPGLASADGTFTLGKLKSFLTFLNQPVRGVLSDMDVFKNAGELQGARAKIHQTLRFLTTGSASIPELYDDPSDQHADCHHKTQREMQVADLWRSEPEIGNPKNVLSAIPNSAMGLKEGISFRVRPAAFGQTPLAIGLRGHIKAATGIEPDITASAITMNATQFQKFCQSVAQDPNLEAHIKETIAQERFEERKTKIENRVQDVAYARAISAAVQSKPYNFADALKNVSVYTSSALKPMVTADAMRDFWASRHYINHGNPVEDIINDFEDFERTILHYSNSGNITPQRSQAIMDEFYPLLSFCTMVAEQTKLKDTQMLFNSARAVPVLAHEAALSPSQQEILACMRKAMGKGSTAGEFVVASGNSLMTVAREACSFAIEKWPYVLLPTAAYITYQTNPELRNTISVAWDMAFGQPQVVATDIFANPPPISMSAGGDFKDQICHSHGFGKLAVTHCFFADAIQNFTSGVMEQTEQAIASTRIPAEVYKESPTGFMHHPAYLDVVTSEFSTKGRAIIKPLGDLTFKANLLQLAAHGVFFGYTGALGFRHGARAYTSGTKGFFGDVVNTAIPLVRDEPRAAIAKLGEMRMISGTYVGDMLCKARPSAHAALLDTINQARLVPMISMPNNGQGMSMLLAQAAEDRNAAEAEFKIGLAGTLKRKFTISSENLGHLEKALNDFDFVMRHLSEELRFSVRNHKHDESGCSHCEHGEQAPLVRSWYQRFLEHKVEQTTNALRAFRKDQNIEALQNVFRDNLVDIMGAQIRHQGQSSLYGVLFPDADGPRKNADTAYLKIHANQFYGARSRGEKILSFGERLGSGQGEISWDKVKAAIGLSATSAWDDIVNTGRMMQKAWKKAPDVIFSVKGRDVSSKNMLLAAAAGGAVMMDVTGTSKALLDPQLADGVNALSGVIGQGYTAGTLLSAFGVYNIWDDIIINDIGIAFGVAMTAGVMAHYAVQRGIRPVVDSAKEISIGHKLFSLIGRKQKQEEKPTPQIYRLKNEPTAKPKLRFSPADGENRGEGSYMGKNIQFVHDHDHDSGPS